MRKHYRTIVFSSLALGLLSLGLTSGPSTPGVLVGPSIQWGGSSAWAGDAGSHSYGVDGYDAEGFDRKGYDRDGFNKDGYDAKGHDHDGYDRDGYREDGRHRDGHYDSGRDRHGRHDKPIDAGSTTGEAKPFTAKPTVKQY